MKPSERNRTPPPASFLQVLGAVLSSFFGIRRRAAGERDASSIRPLHVVVAGLLAGLVFVVVLVLVVRLVIRFAAH